MPKNHRLVIPPVDPAELKFALRLMDEASRLRVPMEDPLVGRFVVRRPDGSVQGYQFTDNPLTRAISALTAHYQEQRWPNDQIVALGFRCLALPDLYRYPALRDHIAADDSVSDALIGALAVVPFTRKGKPKMEELFTLLNVGENPKAGSICLEKDPETTTTP